MARGGTAIGVAMDLGYPGSFSRNGDCVISNRPVDLNATESIAFGDLVALNPDNTVTKLPAGQSNTDLLLGIAVREVKQFQEVGQDHGDYKAGEPCDVLERGSVTIICETGTPTAGGKVYFVPATAAISAAAAGNVEIPNMRFTTGKRDNNNIVELTVLTRG